MTTATTWDTGDWEFAGFRPGPPMEPRWQVAIAVLVVLVTVWFLLQL